MLEIPLGKLVEIKPPLELIIIKKSCPGELTLKLNVSPTLAEIEGSFPDTFPFWSEPDNV